MDETESGLAGTFKVGWTRGKNPKKRISDIKIASPYPVRVVGIRKGGRVSERWYQKIMMSEEVVNKFGITKMQGEWFHATSFRLDELPHPPWKTEPRSRRLIGGIRVKEAHLKILLTHAQLKRWRNAALAGHEGQLVQMIRIVVDRYVAALEAPRYSAPSVPVNSAEILTRSKGPNR